MCSVRYCYFVSPLQWPHAVPPRSLYDWSQRLSEGNLRKSVHHVLCSACLVCPAGFTSLQEWMGVITAGSEQVGQPTNLRHRLPNFYQSSKKSPKIHFFFT